MTQKCVCGEPISFCSCEPAAPNTTARISRPVRCDLCWEGGIIQLAVIDGKARDEGWWAYFCASHWVSKGVGRLGLGLGQRLIVEDAKVPSERVAPRSKINCDAPEKLVAEA